MKLKPTTKSYIAGTLVMMAVMSLVQDCQGLEGYIERVRSRWVDASITVPLAIATVVIGAWLYLSAIGDSRKK